MQLTEANAQDFRVAVHNAGADALDAADIKNSGGYNNLLFPADGPQLHLSYQAGYYGESAHFVYRLADGHAHLVEAGTADPYDRGDDTPDADHALQVLRPAIERALQERGFAPTA